MGAKAVALDEFESAGPLKPARCWFARLTAEQQEKVAAAHEAGYSQPTIARVVNSWGVAVSRSRVGEHLRGSCSCD